MNTLNPLVRRGLILSYRKLDGLNEEKYEFVLPGKKKQEKEHNNERERRGCRVRKERM